MDHKPDCSRPTQANVPTSPWKWLAPLVAAPAILAAIGGLSWADAPTILLKGLIVLALTGFVVGVLYLLFRRQMR
jgi:hypothetical protein